jgi:hypothetical protein
MNFFSIVDSIENFHKNDGVNVDTAVATLTRKNSCGLKRKNLSEQKGFSK